MRVLIVLGLWLTMTQAFAEDHRHGEVSQTKSGEFQTWHAEKSQWQSIEQFWDDFSQDTGAKHWGASVDYPNYDDVNEFDTFLVKTDQGSCLMQFFHSRWRRANDVQRWDEAFNEHSACPYVFD